MNFYFTIQTYRPHCYHPTLKVTLPTSFSTIRCHTSDIFQFVFETRRNKDDFVDDRHVRHNYQTNMIRVTCTHRFNYNSFVTTLSLRIDKTIAFSKTETINNMETTRLPIRNTEITWNVQVSNFTQSIRRLGTYALSSSIVIDDSLKDIMPVSPIKRHMVVTSSAVLQITVVAAV